MAFKLAFALVAAIFLAGSAESIPEEAIHTYDYKKCVVKYQVCCEKKYECGYDYKKIKVPKTCYKDECYDNKYPVKYKKCETRYKYKKVCQHDKKAYSHESVRTYDRPHCYTAKHPYEHCYYDTKYESKKVCNKKSYDCSYYKTEKYPKYCSKHECGPYKYKKYDGKDY